MPERPDSVSYCSRCSGCEPVQQWLFSIFVYHHKISQAAFSMFVYLLQDITARSLYIVTGYHCENSVRYLCTSPYIYHKHITVKIKHQRITRNSLFRLYFVVYLITTLDTHLSIISSNPYSGTYPCKKIKALYSTPHSFYSLGKSPYLHPFFFRFLPFSACYVIRFFWLWDFRVWCKSPKSQETE